MVDRVGHVALRVTDLERSVDFAERILGLRESLRDGTTSYLTCNERHHELMLLAGEAVACDHLAFETYDPEGVDRLRAQVTPLDEAPEQGVGDAVRFVGPGGFVFEVFHGMQRTGPRHYDTAGVRPRKFEHITVKSSVKEELERFLEGVLGLRVSDRAEEQIVWFRASDEHHGFSVIRSDVDQLQHYAWQVDWESIRRVGDRLVAHDRTFLWGPGHHGIGDNYFSYFVDADGVIVEYSADMQRIEDERTYEPRIWPDVPLSVNLWGNPPPPPEFIAGGIPVVRQ
jgi:catechol 2,3-dioxygenase-like lactoylglutathione lyase family enzyme